METKFLLAQGHDGNSTERQKYPKKTRDIPQGRDGNSAEMGRGRGWFDREQWQAGPDFRLMGEGKIPSEMEVAPRYKPLTLLTWQAWPDFWLVGEEKGQNNVQD